MDTSQIKAYAPQARNDFIRAVTERANRYGIFGDDNIEKAVFEGDVAMIGDRAVSRKQGELREKLAARVRQQGFEMVIRSMAYTWFNRFVALRYMELHDYLDHGMRVLSDPNGSDVPEILSRVADVDLPGLDREKALELRLAGNRDNELYRMLIVAQCNALHQSMPFLFEPVDSETELLLPDNLLNSDSPVRKLVNAIDESLWENVEIIGWIYQFYISEKKSEVIGKTVKSEDIPAATQLFTPNWIVKYMVQNTLGRMWLATYPDSPLRERMEYYIEPAEQDPEAQNQLDKITPDYLNPEEITFMD
ncbi:MAG: SAM-dependent methyltransferase, partial [Desulfosalsimonas sp.]